MEYLRDYARSPCPKTGLKRRVILTIHQPSSFIWELVDNVILLAEGRLMYQGRRAKMEAFFAATGHPTPLNYNPADHYIRAIFKNPTTLDENQEDKIQIQNPCSSLVHELWSDKFKKWSGKESKSLATEKPAAAAAAAADTIQRSGCCYRRSWVHLVQ
jgi:ABC-type multidrug transport system ATPase subunit